MLNLPLAIDPPRYFPLPSPWRQLLHGPADSDSGGYGGGGGGALCHDKEVYLGGKRLNVPVIYVCVCVCTA